MLPGFVDAHIHPVTGGMELGQCNLNDLPDAPAILAKVRAVRGGEAGRRVGSWAAAGRSPRFPGGAPTREALDAVVPDRPVFLSSADGHSSWVNTKALALAGIDRDTQGPEGRPDRARRAG